MTTVEEIVDAIRKTFSPDYVVELPKSSPLQATLRLLAYQIGHDDTSDANERAQEWYAVESEKFYKKPVDINVLANKSYEEPAAQSRHPLHEAWELDRQRREHQREVKKRARQNRAVRDEWVDDSSKDSRLQQYMEKISQHIQEGTQWQGPQELDPEAEFEQKLLERRERHYRTVKDESQRAQEKLKAKEEELNGLEDNLQKRREARRAQLELDRQERERQLKEQEESRKKRREHIEHRQKKLEEEEHELEEQERERQQLWRQRQAELLARREQEFTRREQEWQQWEENEARQKEEEKALRLREDEENAHRRDALLAADAEVARLKKAEEEAELEAFVQRTHQEAEAIATEAGVSDVLNRRHARVQSSSAEIPTSEPATSSPESVQVTEPAAEVALSSQ